MQCEKIEYRELWNICDQIDHFEESGDKILKTFQILRQFCMI